MRMNDGLTLHVPSTLFKSYQDDERMVMKGSVQ